MTDRKPFVVCRLCTVRIYPVTGYNTVNIPDILGVHNDVITAVSH